MRNVHPIYVSVVALLTLIQRPASADPLSELSSFSVFDKIDLAQLAKTDVKMAHGPPMANPRYLSVQSCYAVSGTPGQHLEALRNWNPSAHRELKVFLHADVPGSPSEAAFAKIKHAEAIGITFKGVSVDYAALIGHKNKVVTQLQSGIKQLLTANGVRQYTGVASFKDRLRGAARTEPARSDR